MKTILIVIAGMADRRDKNHRMPTALAQSHIPSLDMLAQRGDIAQHTTVPSGREISYKNALLTIMGYDLQRGEPSLEELREFGLDNATPLTAYQSLRPFIIPGFSGHGVCVTPSAWVRGVAKCALLKPLDIYSPGSTDAEILETMAELTCQSIIENEFLLVYVDSPLKASFRGDYDAKVKALEQIDRHLVNPIADFVWKSDLYINLAITTDLATPYSRGEEGILPAFENKDRVVPSVLYFNNHDHEGNPDKKFDEETAQVFPMLYTTDLIRFLSNFEVEELGI